MWARTYGDFAAGAHRQAGALDLLEGVVAAIRAVLSAPLVHMAVRPSPHLATLVVEQILDFDALRLRFHLELVVHHQRAHSPGGSADHIVDTFVRQEKISCIEKYDMIC